MFPMIIIIIIIKFSSKQGSSPILLLYSLYHVKLFIISNSMISL